MNFKSALLTMVAVASLGILSVGCSSPCDDLQDKCVECGGTEAACAVPDGADSDACQAALDLYDSLGCG